MKPEEDAVRAGLPGEPEQDGLAAERFFADSGPAALGAQFGEGQALASAPDAGGVIEGDLLFGGHGFAALLGSEGGDGHARIFLQIYFLEFPSLSGAQAVAGFVFEQQHVILGREDADATIVVRVAVFIVDG